MPESQNVPSGAIAIWADRAGWQFYGCPGTAGQPEEPGVRDEPQRFVRVLDSLIDSSLWSHYRCEPLRTPRAPRSRKVAGDVSDSPRPRGADLDLFAKRFVLARRSARRHERYIVGPTRNRTGRKG